jgi:Uncharacterized protein conserved in bacteria
MTLFDVDVSSESVKRSAVFSEDGSYRYSLARWWDNEVQARDIWIMCNPSTADSMVDDATIRRCIGFSRRFGSGGFVVVNAYGFRATKPAVMWAAAEAGTDIVGPANDGWIKAHLMTAVGRVIVAWGAHPRPDRCYEVDQLIRAEGREPLCLGVTKDGMPRHPLMLRTDAALRPWAWRGAA